MITKNPFKESGALKAGFKAFDGDIWIVTCNDPSIAMKSSDSKWSYDDCPRIGRRLLYKGVKESDIRSVLNISEATARAVLRSHYKLTPRNLLKLREYENTL